MPAFLPALVLAVVPTLIGLAQVFCQVSADDSSRPGATIQAALNGNGQTAELTYGFRGQSTVLETAAPVSFGEEGGVPTVVASYKAWLDGIASSSQTDEQDLQVFQSSFVFFPVTD